MEACSFESISLLCSLRPTSHVNTLPIKPPGRANIRKFSRLSIALLIDCLLIDSY